MELISKVIFYIFIFIPFNSFANAELTVYKTHLDDKHRTEKVIQLEKKIGNELLIKFDEGLCKTINLLFTYYCIILNEDGKPLFFDRIAKLKELAIEGVVSANFTLISYYFIENDFVNTLKFATIASNKGSVKAELLLAHMKIYNMGVKGEEKAGYKIVKKLERLINTDLALYTELINAYGGRSNIMKQFLLQQNTENISATLARLFSFIQSSKSSSIKFFKILKTLSKTNDDVKWLLGTHYAVGTKLVKKSIEKAKFWFRKAAVKGHLNSAIFLGDLLVRNINSKEKLLEAEKWLVIGANSGHDVSKRNLMVMYEEYSKIEGMEYLVDKLKILKKKQLH